MLARLVLPALVALSASLSLDAQAQVVQPAKPEPATEVRTVPLAAGSTLKVTNVNGRIRVEAWDREQVEFTGAFKPSSKDEHVKVVLEPGAKGLEIRAEYPKSKGVMYRGPEVAIDLKVPRRVLPRLENVNGSIELTGTEGDARLNSVNGGLRVTNLQGALEAETVNGAIHLDQVKGRLEVGTVNGGIAALNLDTLGQGLSAKTVNGGVKLQMGALKGRLVATTVNGGVTFKAQGAEQVEIKRTKVTATFPGSDQQLRISTVNGGIALE